MLGSSQKLQKATAKNNHASSSKTVDVTIYHEISEVFNQNNGGVFQTWNLETWIRNLTTIITTHGQPCKVPKALRELWKHHIFQNLSTKNRFFP